jgi:hypothetical protein
MSSIPTFGRWFFLALALSAVAPLCARAAGPTPAELRARKLAARRYVGGVVSLPSSAFAGGLHVCVRETPAGITGYWKVPPKAVDVMDADLLKHLRKSGIDKRLPFAARLYLRQYVGFVHDGVRKVFINALLVEKGSPLADEAQKAFPKSCASASGFWGIQYDTQAKQFVNFAAR